MVEHSPKNLRKQGIKKKHTNENLRGEIVEAY